MRVFCDFDGTISTFDTTDMVLGRLAAPEWEDYERAWLAGTISAAECMRSQIALIGPDDVALDAVLDTVEVTPGFASLVAWCAEAGVPLTVVSDGVDYFIRRVLRRHGFGHLPVIANVLGRKDGGRVLNQPWQRTGCAAQSGVCKCQAVEPEAAGPLVFIGDGRSDFCVSARADIVFARDKLAAYCKARGMAYHDFSDFHDIRAALAGLHDQAALRAAV